MAKVPFQCPGCEGWLQATEAAITRGANMTCPRCRVLVHLAEIKPAPVATPSATSAVNVPPPPGRRWGLISAVVVALVVLTAGGLGVALWGPAPARTPHEQLVQKAIATLKEAVEVMREIKDRGTIEIHHAEFRRTVQAAHEVVHELARTPAPKDEAAQRGLKRMSVDLKFAGERYQAEYTRLSNLPDCMGAIQQANLDMIRLVNELGPVDPDGGLLALFPEFAGPSLNRQP